MQCVTSLEPWGRAASAPELCTSAWTKEILFHGPRCSWERNQVCQECKKCQDSKCCRWLLTAIQQGPLWFRIRAATSGICQQPVDRFWKKSGIDLSKGEWWNLFHLIKGCKCIKPKVPKSLRCLLQCLGDGKILWFWHAKPGLQRTREVCCIFQWPAWGPSAKRGVALQNIELTRWPKFLRVAVSNPKGLLELPGPWIGCGLANCPRQGFCRRKVLELGAAFT